MRQEDGVRQEGDGVGQEEGEDKRKAENKRRTGQEEGVGQKGGSVSAPRALDAGMFIRTTLRVFVSVIRTHQCSSVSSVSFAFIRVINIGNIVNK